jgi:hypothetical protein
MPGVAITTGAVSGPSSPGRSPATTYFLVGLSERGPISVPTLLTSFGDYVRIFGDSTPYATLYDQVRTFFEEGGNRCYVVRVTGEDADTGNLSTALQDQGTTPAPTLSVAASSPGAWSSRIGVKVLAGATDDTFRIQVLVDGDVVEDYANLHSPAEAVTRINDSTVASAYIRLTNAGSAAVAPDNNPAPLASPVTLSAGDDDRASIVTADYVTALGLFTDGFGDGAVAIPGMGSAVHTALVTHANLFNRIALLSEARSANKSTLLASAASLDAPRAGLFAPWIKVPDGSGGSKAISPESYIAACRARAHEATGPWRAAAGEIAKARWVTAADQVFTFADSEDLDAGKVNVTLTIGNAVRNYGWRSTSNDTANWRFLSSADVINRVVTESKKLLEPYVFSAIDGKGHLLASMAGTLEGLVKPLADLGGLFPWLDDDGTIRDPGYKITVDDTLNTRASLGDNKIYAQLGLRPAPTAALIYLQVTKASVIAAL